MTNVLYDTWSWWSFSVGAASLAVFAVVTYAMITIVRDWRATRVQPAIGDPCVDLHRDEAWAAQKRLLVPVRMPAFGVPTAVTYRAEEYREPMRCSGAFCGHRVLMDQEQVVMWAVRNGPDGSVLALCAECMQQPA